MTEAAKEARRAYQRKWNRENPDKLREYKERYWERKAEQAEAEADREPAPDQQTENQ